MFNSVDESRALLNSWTQMDTNKKKYLKNVKLKQVMDTGVDTFAEYWAPILAFRLLGNNAFNQFLKKNPKYVAGLGLEKAILS